jgi:hypothetical protein
LLSQWYYIKHNIFCLTIVVLADYIHMYISC